MIIVARLPHVYGAIKKVKTLLLYFKANEGQKAFYCPPAFAFIVIKSVKMSRESEEVRALVLPKVIIPKELYITLLIITVSKNYSLFLDECCILLVRFAASDKSEGGRPCDLRTMCKSKKQRYCLELRRIHCGIGSATESWPYIVTP